MLANFEERWQKASKPRGMGKLRSSSDDSLLMIDRMPDIMGLSEASSANDNDPESWHVQVMQQVSFGLIISLCSIVMLYVVVTKEISFLSLN